ncbi:5978_t:CDS:2, partial [Racocetra fulgida]
VDKTATSEYARKIQRLSDVVDEFKLVSPVSRAFSQARFVKHAHQSQEEKNKENQLELKMVRQAEKELKEELMQPPTHSLNTEPDNMRTYNEKRMDTSNIETVLQHHRKTQDELTNELVKMAGKLKMNSVTFGDILAKDVKVHEAQSSLGINLDRLKKEGARLGAYAAQSGKTTWLVWGVSSEGKDPGIDGKEYTLELDDGLGMLSELRYA